MEPTRTQINAAFDAAVDDASTACTHCGHDLGLALVPEGHICPNCGFMRHRLSDRADAYHAAWIAQNAIGGIIDPHQSRPLPARRVRELGY